jgi:hypothetical protein
MSVGRTVKSTFGPLWAIVAAFAGSGDDQRGEEGDEQAHSP